MAMAQMILAKRLTTQTFVADPCQEDWSGPAFLTSGRGGLRVLFRPSERGGACQEAWCSRAFLTSGLARTILFVRESALLANGSGGGRFPCRRQPAKDTRYTSAPLPPRATSTKLSAVCRRAPTSMPRKKQIRLRERAIKTPRARELQVGTLELRAWAQLSISYVVIYGGSRLQPWRHRLWTHV